jgi:Putative auto-transporter adhesin, head GIN domain
MKKLNLLLFLAFLSFFTSCEKVIGEGPLVTETRTTGSFTGIESEVSGDVFYIQGSTYKVELTAQQNILNVIETPIVNNKLVVRFKNNVRVKSHEQITIKVTAPSITSIGASGSGNVTVAGPLTGNDLSFHLSGSGNITLPVITCSHLETTLSGSGNISVAGGTATAETLKISGSGNIDAPGVLSKSASTSTSGSGTIRLSASETLDITITGSGSVYYSGNPVVTTSITGSGRVIHQ